MSDPAPLPPTQDPTPAPVEPTPVDLSKLTDDDIAKLFDDERLYRNPKMADLRDKAKKAKEYEDLRKKDEEEKLKAQGEYQKLAEQKDQELNALKETVKAKELNLAITQLAMQAGVIDVDAVLALIDKTAISFDEEGKVQGVKEAVDGLLTQKPYLVGKKTQTLGNPTNPVVTDVTEFTMSQIADPAFYQANYAAIQKAMREGRIKNDRR